MAYETTRVPVVRSQDGIRRMILSRGGTAVAFVSVSNPPQEGFHAQLPIEGRTYTVRIVARVGESPRGDPERELRRTWRVLFYHLKGLFEAAESGVLEFRELVLPYIVTRDGRTIAECLLPQLEGALAARPERLLPGKTEGEL